MKKRFIFDENYIKRYSKRNKTRWLIVGVCALTLVLIMLIAVLKNTNKPVKKENVPVYELKEEVVIESGSKLPEVVDYFNRLEYIDTSKIKVSYPSGFEVSFDTSKCTSEDIEKLNNEEITASDLTCVKQNLLSPKTYGIVLKIDEKEEVVNLKVVDTTPPILNLKDITLFAGDNYNKEDFIENCFDVNGECKAFYELDEYGGYKDPGEYLIKMRAMDKYGNISDSVEAKLTLKETVKNIYTVTFNTDGGEGVNRVKVEDGALVEEPTTRRDDYNFLGWYLGNEKFDFNTPITKNTTLIAKWEKMKVENPIENPVEKPIDDTPTIINVTSVSLNYKKIYLQISESKTVSATYRPSNATSKTITWQSANPSVATVANGVITGHSLGTTTVSATVGGKTASVEVEVIANSSICKYGDTNYDKSYTLSVDLSQNNCAIAPGTYSEDLSSSDYTRLVQEINNKGHKLTYYNASYTKVYNTVGTGMVGYQITIYANTTDGNGIKNIVYILKSDGTRIYSKNDLGLS